MARRLRIVLARQENKFNEAHRYAEDGESRFG
jgi:hypothetical protein